MIFDDVKQVLKIDIFLKPCARRPVLKRRYRGNAKPVSTGDVGTPKPKHFKFKWKFKFKIDFGNEMKIEKSMLTDRKKIQFSCGPSTLIYMQSVKF